jgi:hypothetical protein
MSHQINFFLTPCDISSLENWLRNLCDLRILHSRASDPAPRVVESLNLSGDDKRWPYLGLTRPDLLDQVVTRHVPVQNYWSLDEQRSSIIEFSACLFDGEILRERRMYYVDGFYDGDQWETKPETLRNWAKSVFVKTKKMLRRRYESYHIGPDAENWLATSAGKLVTAADKSYRNEPGKAL